MQRAQIELKKSATSGRKFPCVDANIVVRSSFQGERSHSSDSSVSFWQRDLAISS